MSDVTTNTYYFDTDTDLARRGQLQTVTDAVGNVTTYAGGAAPFNTYDLYGHPRRVADPNGVLREMTYDPRGALRISTLKGVPGDPVDLTTTYDFDDAGRATKVTLPLGNGTSYGYDGSNRLTDTIRFDSKGSEQERLHVTYDVMSQKESEEAQSCDVYDDFRRMRRQTSPVSGVTNYTHDPAGNLLTSTDADTPPRLTTRTYDAVNRVLTAVSTRSGFPTETAIYTYDDPTAGNFGKGRLASMTDPSGSTIYAYERRGLLRLEGKTIQGDPYNLAYTYDGNGNRNSVSYPSGRTVTYSFDFADRPYAASSGGATYVSAASYKPFGPEASLSFGNGTTKTMSFDNRYRPTENKLVKDSPLTTLADYVYGEDDVGNITSIADAQDAGFNRTFGYDDLNRLTTANSGASLWGAGSHAYDKMGNILSLTLGSARTASFTYAGTLPKLTQVTETGFGTRDVTYDAPGNETQVGSGTFAYSTRNYLSSGDGLTYTYDGRGLRAVVVTSKSEKRYFLYSSEMNLLAESDLTTTLPPAISYEYIWFNGHPVAEENAGTHWTCTDHLGTPFLQTDSLANIFWRAEYEPYGRVFSLRTTAQHQPLRLPGQESEELNLSADGNGSSERFYNVFRWYRFGWSRYTQSDPLGFLTTDPVNNAPGSIYTYASNHPVITFDPYGLYDVYPPGYKIPPGTSTIQCDGKGNVVPFISPGNSCNRNCKIEPCGKQSLRSY